MRICLGAFIMKFFNIWNILSLFLFIVRMFPNIKEEEDIKGWPPSFFMFWLGEQVIIIS